MAGFSTVKGRVDIYIAFHIARYIHHKSNYIAFPIAQGLARRRRQVLYCAQVEQATLPKEDPMHPDQLYSTRQLQHADLLAEAERERQASAARGSRRSWLSAVLRRWLAPAQRRGSAKDLYEPGMVQ